MDSKQEALLVVAVYLFVATSFTLPFLVAYLFIRITRVITRAIKILNYVEEGETESRKYHE